MADLDVIDRTTHRASVEEPGPEFGRLPVRSLAAMLEQIPDAVLCCDRAWRITYANREAMRVSRLTPADLNRRSHWELFPETCGTEVERAYRTAMEHAKAGHVEHFYQPFQVWVDVHIYPTEEGVALFYRDITEQRMREHALDEQQGLLSVVQQTALAATWDYELATGKLTFGPGSFPLTGRPMAEIESLTQLEGIVFPGDLERVRAAVLDTLAGSPMVVEFQLVAPDGTRRWVESRGQAVCEGGVPKHLRGMAIDITERKKNEEALLASEARYRVLADLNPQAIWMGAPDGRITYANQGFLDYLGLTLETLDGLGWLNAFQPEERERVLETWHRSVQTGVDYDIEVRMRRARDGAVRWWALRALPVRDETGAILHWLGVGADIHDQKTAADALHQRQQETERQRAELETVYQTAPVGLALFDPVEFRCLRMNEREEEILGLPQERIVGRTITEIAPLEGLREMFEIAAAGHPVRNQIVEGELPTRPGEHRVWNVSHSPVYDADGAIQSITAAWLDITHLKRAEAALIQSEKLAAVGRLASSISHEINNPLEAITNLLYLIALSEDLPHELKIYVHMAQSELARVSQIATQTLRFHRQAVKPTWVTPAELIDAVLNLYQGRLANSGIKVQAVYATEARVLCFENDIRQVLNNLIANAIDAMRNGGRLIARAHDATDHRTGRAGVRLTIADTGHGMSPEVKARLYEPFYTTKDLNGTGLGLWISEGIVQRHQGRLSVRSTQDPARHGTVFSLFLPSEEEPDPEGLLLDTAAVLPNERLTQP
jgi:PAS domain S-box-containing protein